MKQKNITPQKQTCTLNERDHLDNPITCNHKTYDQESGLCIFHCKEKPLDAFREALQKEINETNSDDKKEIHDYRLFIFPDKIDLRKLEFKKKANFYKAIFGKNTDFSYATFGKNTNFSQVTFGDNSSFQSVTFGNKTSFDGAIFGNNSSFNNSTFGDGTMFDEVKFGNSANFNHTTFGDNTEFIGTRFEDNTDFNDATFGNNSTFYDSKFGNKNHFFKTTFGNHTIFTETDFMGITSFRGAKFGNGTFFDNFTFGNKTSFEHATFEGRSIFNNHQVIGETEWSINLGSLRIKNPQDFKIEHLNMEKIELRNTNWTNVEFLDCKWPMIKDRKAVYDEIIDTEKKNLASIEQLYNRLQTNFENAKQYSDAGDFYIGAMEMRRFQIARNRNKVWRWLMQNVLSVMAWYRLLSFYGESYTRPLWPLAIIIFLFPFIYLLTGFEYSKIDSIINLSPVNFNNLGDFFIDYGKALNVSFHAATFRTNSMYFKLDAWGNFVYILQTILSASIITLFLLALRRKFGRR